MVLIDDHDEYAKLVRGMNPPRVEIDNEVSKIGTFIQVDSVNTHGTLLALVQVITDLNLVVRKAYFTADGDWFMDVFYVTDRDGQKVTDEATLTYIQTTLESDECYYTEARNNSVGMVPSEDDDHQYSSIELTGTDRPGLLSEVCAVLSDVRCAVVSAELWTRNTRVAAVVQVADAATGGAISADSARVAEISRRLAFLLRSRSGCHATVAAEPALVAMHKERRLHQMMSADPESGVGGRLQRPAPGTSKTPATAVEVTDCAQRGYTFVVVRCRDVPKLLFDTVCTITDAHYVVYHGKASTEPDGAAYQEYYVRNKAGAAATEPERVRLARQLEAAVERRFADGVELEVRSGDRARLLSDVTRIIRENGLTILRAGVKSQGGEAVDTFYVSDPMGLDYPVEPRTIDTIRAQIGEATLRVKKNPFADADQQQQHHAAAASAVAFLLGSVSKFYAPSRASPSSSSTSFAQHKSYDGETPVIMPSLFRMF